MQTEPEPALLPSASNAHLPGRAPRPPPHRSASANPVAVDAGYGYVSGNEMRSTLPA